MELSSAKEVFIGGRGSTSTYVDASLYADFAREFLSKITYEGDFSLLSSCKEDCDCVAGKCLWDSTAWYWGVQTARRHAERIYDTNSTFPTLQLYREDTAIFEWLLFIADAQLRTCGKNLHNCLLHIK